MNSLVRLYKRWLDQEVIQYSRNRRSRSASVGDRRYRWLWDYHPKNSGTRTVSGKIRQLLDNAGLARSALNWGILWTRRLKDETYTSLKRLACYVSGLTFRS
jgi:hypothetical protein